MASEIRREKERQNALQVQIPGDPELLEKWEMGDEGIYSDEAIGAKEGSKSLPTSDFFASSVSLSPPRYRNEQLCRGLSLYYPQSDDDEGHISPKLLDAIQDQSFLPEESTSPTRTILRRVENMGTPLSLPEQSCERKKSSNPNSRNISDWGSVLMGKPAKDSSTEGTIGTHVSVPHLPLASPCPSEKSPPNKLLIWDESRGSQRRGSAYTCGEDRPSTAPTLFQKTRKLSSPFSKFEMPPASSSTNKVPTLRLKLKIVSSSGEPKGEKSKSSVVCVDSEELSHSSVKLSGERKDKEINTSNHKDGEQSSSSDELSSTQQEHNSLSPKELQELSARENIPLGQMTRGRTSPVGRTRSVCDEADAFDLSFVPRLTADMSGASCTRTMTSSPTSYRKSRSDPGSPREASKQSKEQIIWREKKIGGESSDIGPMNGISSSSSDEVITLCNMDRVQVVGYCINSVRAIFENCHYAFRATGLMTFLDILNLSMSCFQVLPRIEEWC